MKNTHCAHRWGWVHKGARGQRPQLRCNRNTARQHVGQPVAISQGKQLLLFQAEKPTLAILSALHRNLLPFDWFYSNYYCLWSTTTAAPMLSLEVNESSDLTVFDWTTLKWKKKKIKVSQFGGLIWNESPRQAPMSHFASSPSAAAERPCADVYTWTWKSSGALTPLLTSLRGMQRTCKTQTHTAPVEAAHKQTHIRATAPTCRTHFGQKSPRCTTVQVASTCKYLHVLSPLTSSFMNTAQIYLWKKHIFPPAEAIFPFK